MGWTQRRTVSAPPPLSQSVASYLRILFSNVSALPYNVDGNVVTFC